VARAKRTARADARRRYRAEHNLPDEATLDDEPTSSGEARGATTSGTAKRTPDTPARMGIGEAFRASFRPLDIRGDVAALPYLAFRTKALWIPLALVLGSTIAFAVTSGQDIVTQFLFAYFVQTPAIGGVFIAGFLAPRASWLLGVIVGLVSAACYSILILTVFSAVVAASPIQGIARDAILSSFVLSPLMGAFFAAAAAWYRRFLQYSNPNRGRRRQEKARRGPDGKTRAAGGGKAGARR
jgi:hypothetical protein